MMVYWSKFREKCCPTLDRAMPQHDTSRKADTLLAEGYTAGRGKVDTMSVTVVTTYQFLTLSRKLFSLYASNDLANLAALLNICACVMDRERMSYYVIQ